MYKLARKDGASMRCLGRGQINDGEGRGSNTTSCRRAHPHFLSQSCCCCTSIPDLPRLKVFVFPTNTNPSSLRRVELAWRVLAKTC